MKALSIPYTLVNSFNSLLTNLTVAVLVTNYITAQEHVYLYMKSFIALSLQLESVHSNNITLVGKFNGGYTVN